MFRKTYICSNVYFKGFYTNWPKRNPTEWDLSSAGLSLLLHPSNDSNSTKRAKPYLTCPAITNLFVNVSFKTNYRYFLFNFNNIRNVLNWFFKYIENVFCTLTYRCNLHIWLINSIIRHTGNWTNAIVNLFLNLFYDWILFLRRPVWTVARPHLKAIRARI